MSAIERQIKTITGHRFGPHTWSIFKMTVMCNVGEEVELEHSQPVTATYTARVLFYEDSGQFCRNSTQWCVPSAHRKVSQHAACCAVARTREALPEKVEGENQFPKAALWPPHVRARTGTVVRVYPLSHTTAILRSSAAPSCKRSSQLDLLTVCALAEGYNLLATFCWQLCLNCTWPWES